MEAGVWELDQAGQLRGFGADLARYIEMNTGVQVAHLDAKCE